MTNSPDDSDQTFLLRLSDTLRAQTGVEVLGKLATQLIAQRLGADRVYLVSLNPQYDTVRVSHETRRQDMPPLQGTYRSSDFPAAIQEIFERTIVYTDVRTDARLIELDRLSFAGLGAVGFLATAIRRGSQTMIWAAGAVSTQPRFWTASEVVLFENAVERTWAALERVSVEEALRQSEDKYRTLFASLDEGFHISELLYNEAGRPIDWRYVEVNAVFAQQTGVLNVTGQLGSVTTPNTESYWLDAYDRVLKTGEPLRVEHYHATTRRWYSAYASRVGGAGSRLFAVIFDDITDRKETEEALRESQQRFESIANLVPDLLWDSGPDGTTTWYNQRWLEYTGQTFEEAIGWGWTQSIYPDDRPASDRRYREAVATGTALQQEHRIRRHDGVYRWFVVSAAPLKDARGQVVKMYGAATDIHERKLAETALQKSEERWRLAIEATELATWEWHLDTNQVYWNEQHFRLFGMEPQAGPLSPDAFMRHVHPHEQARIKDLLERTIAERGVYDTEFCAVLEDGSTRWMSGYGRITEERDGQPVRMSGVMLDVDERRRAQEALLASEQKFRTLSDAAPALIWQHDGQGRNQFVNQRFTAFVGLTPQQLEGVGWQSIIHPDEQQAYIADYVSAVGEQRGFSHTSRLRRADGEWRWFANYAQPLFSQDGQFLGHVGASVDITDRQQQAEALRVADRRKDEFLAMLAHELRNPLAPIRNGLQLLDQTSTTDPTLSVLLPIMNRNMTHVVRMVDDLLDVSRISRGKIELTRHRIELGALVSQALESMRPQYASANRQLRAILPATPLYLLGDATRLHQVVTNLLTNGLRYTGENGQVQLSLEAVDGQALLQVSDNGIGLSVDQLEAIFELFVQVNNSLARSNGGLGLGLTLVQQLVEQHGGWVKAQSPGLGQGSTFSVYLPLD